MFRQSSKVYLSNLWSVLKILKFKNLFYPEKDPTKGVVTSLRGMFAYEVEGYGLYIQFKIQNIVLQWWDTSKSLCLAKDI